MGRHRRGYDLEKAAGCWEKGTILSLPEGYNLGGSCYLVKKEASATLALPFNPEPLPAHGPG